MTGLAALLLVGSSLANPTPEAAAALASACDGGDAKACGELGARHAGGLGVPVDLARAGALTKKGCDGGDLDSCTHLVTKFEPSFQKRAPFIKNEASSRSFSFSAYVWWRLAAEALPENRQRKVIP